MAKGVTCIEHKAQANIADQVHESGIVPSDALEYTEGSLAAMAALPVRQSGITRTIVILAAIPSQAAQGALMGVPISAA